MWNTCTESHWHFTAYRLNQINKGDVTRDTRYVQLGGIALFPKVTHIYTKIRFGWVNGLFFAHSDHEMSIEIMIFFRFTQKYPFCFQQNEKMYKLIMCPMFIDSREGANSNVFEVWTHIYIHQVSHVYWKKAHLFEFFQIVRNKCL